MKGRHSSTHVCGVNIATTHVSLAHIFFHVTQFLLRLLPNIWLSLIPPAGNEAGAAPWHEAVLQGAEMVPQLPQLVGRTPCQETLCCCIGTRQHSAGDKTIPTRFPPEDAATNVSPPVSCGKQYAALENNWFSCLRSSTERKKPRANKVESESSELTDGRSPRPPAGIRPGPAHRRSALRRLPARATLLPSARRHGAGAGAAALLPPAHVPLLRPGALHGLHHGAEGAAG